jgi:predicted amidohydrolase
MRTVAVSMCLEYRKVKKIEDNLIYIENIFNDIKNIYPDFVVLPEVFAYAGIKVNKRNIDNSWIKVKDFLKKIAKNTNCWVCGSSYDLIDGKIYNSCFFVNRKGEIVSKYDKIHPTEIEMDIGIYPGKKEQKPVETEFGKVGAFICFDANWHSDLKYQVDNGAKLLVFSSAYPAGKILNSISLLYQVFIVAGIWSLTSGIIDNTGRWLVKTDRFSHWVWIDINLQRTVFHWDFQGDKVKKIIEKYKDRVKIETFGDEAIFTLEVLDKDLSIEKIIKEFKLVTYKDYLKRTELKQNKKRKTK